MSGESGNGDEEKVTVQVISLDENHLMEAVIHYMQKKYGNCRVVKVDWVIQPAEGHKLPPIKGMSVRCSVESKKEGKK